LSHSPLPRTIRGVKALIAVAFGVASLAAVNPAPPQGGLVFLRAEGNVARPYFMAADGSGQQRAPVPGYPIYSPDGTRMLYVVNALNPKGASVQRLFVASADGSSKHQIIPDTSGWYQFRDIAWSPDSRRIAYVDEFEVDFASIWVVDRDGRHRKPLTGKWNLDPTWSPDGRTILFTSHLPADGWRLFTMDATGHHRRELVGEYPEDASAIYAPTWSRDGQRIYILVAKSLYVMNRDGSNVQNLTPPGLTIGYYALSPDESQIVVHGVTRPSAARDIFVFAPGGPARQLTTERGADQWPKWSPDGTKIAFESNRDGNSEIYVMNADGSEQTNITRNPAADTSPKWIPSRRLRH